MSETHDDRILEQFTLQAQPFGAVAAHSADSSLRLLAQTAGLHQDDEVLDVACGPGIVACYLARTARTITGVDVVPAMLEQARKAQLRNGLTNVTWEIGNAADLPFPSNTFPLVITRYSFHHFLNPAQVFAEMVRVCKPGGRIAVCDVTPDEGSAERYDALEKLRDPSHVHALPLSELDRVTAPTDVEPFAHANFLLEMALETQLAASFPVPGGADEIRKLVREDVDVNRLSVNAELREGQLWYKLPISIVVRRKLA